MDCRTLPKHSDQSCRGARHPRRGRQADQFGRGIPLEKTPTTRRGFTARSRLTDRASRRGESAFPKCRELDRGPDVLSGGLRELCNDLRRGHPRRQVFEHVVHCDTCADEAGQPLRTPARGAMSVVGSVAVVLPRQGQGRMRSRRPVSRREFVARVDSLRRSPCACTMARSIRVSTACRGVARDGVHELETLG